MRLTLIILLPLLCIGMAAGLWRLADARQTAADVFDRSLLSTAIAVANDVAISEGDALSPRTSQLLADTSGGRVFYHVFAPDGLIVAGYDRVYEFARCFRNVAGFRLGRHPLHLLCAHLSLSKDPISQPVGTALGPALIQQARSVPEGTALVLIL